MMALNFTFLPAAEVSAADDVGEVDIVENASLLFDCPSLSCDDSADMSHQLCRAYLSKCWHP